MRKRRLPLLLAILLVITILPICATPVQAAYENTYAVTGNQRADIIGVALTQVGYREGSNNYTKYGVWFGRPNDPWCGIFISWCANQAGIPTSVLRKNGMASPSNFGIPYYSGSSYRPQSGDLFFTKSRSHAGLVYYTEGNYFYTVEGNTSTSSPDGTSVLIRKRTISDYDFGVPSYRGGGNHSYVSGYDTAHPHKEYKFCPHCSDKYYTGSTTTVSDCTSCIQASCNHKYGQWSRVNDSTHSRKCSVCGKTASEGHNWTEVTVTREPTCVKVGYKNQTCTTCNTTVTVTLPATEQHTFEDVTFIDKATHLQICAVCNLEETAAHTPSENWSSDETNHWNECTGCLVPIALEEHSFSEGCILPCDRCGYTLPNGHVINESYASDETGHWNTCKYCTYTENFSEHTYIAACDEFCQSCGFSRETTVAHKTHWAGDQSVHWQGCELCDTKKNISPHTPDPSAKEWEALYCTLCKYELRSEDDHVHSFHTIDSDHLTHWGQCICGADLPPEAHTWNMQTSKCSVCNAKYRANSEALGYDVIILIGISAFLIIALLVVIVLLVRTVKKKQKH